MKPFGLVICVFLQLYCQIVNCNHLHTSPELLGNYQSNASMVTSLNHTLVIVLDSDEDTKSLVCIARYPDNQADITDISKYFKGHVNDVIVQPQKQLAIFTEKDMKHIVVLHDNSEMVPEVINLDFVPTVISIPENNNNGKYFIIFDESERNLHYTLSGGATFKLLSSTVKSFVWQYDNGQNFLLVERRLSLKDPSSSLEYIEFPPRDTTVDPPKLVTLTDQVRNFSVKGDYVFTHRANDTLLYYKRQKFIRTIYYPIFKIDNIHLVDVEKNSIKIIAANDQESRFYIGNYYINSREIRFELSLANITRDYLTKVDSTVGVYIATQKNALKSVITYDNGRTWNEIQNYTKVAHSKIFSSKLVPGVIAVPMGEKLMYSQNGGKSWSSYDRFKSTYNFQFNNILGIMIATDLDKFTNKLIYSTTYGFMWTSHNISIKHLNNQIVYSKDNSLDFYILAHDTEHNNYLIRIDFKTMFIKSCDEPNVFTTDVCILGQNVTYNQRKGPCLPEKTTIETIETCDCNFGDYDCTANFGRTHISQQCKLEPGKTAEKCQPGEIYNWFMGYQKIESSICTEKPSFVCPYAKVDYLLAKTGNTLKLFDENAHQMKNLQYYGYDSRESYEFDLLSVTMFESNHTMVKQHTLNKQSRGKILAQESVYIHNLNYDWISNWMFYIIKEPLMVKAFAVAPIKSTPLKKIWHIKIDTEVTSLTVHTVLKYLYWREGDHFRRTIIKYINNNSDIEVGEPDILLSNYNVGSDLVIDYVANRLYFFSIKEGSFKNCDLSGDNCHNVLKLHSDFVDETPTNAYQIAISHMYIYFYNPQHRTVQYFKRSSDLQSNGTRKLFKHKLNDVTELKCVSKSIQLYTKCLVQYPNSAICTDVLNLVDSTKIMFENPTVSEMVCPNSKFCDGVFDCFYGQDEAYCANGAEEVIKIHNHKFVWIGIVIALGIITFIIASVMLYKRVPIRFTGARYNVVDNRVLLNEEILEDDDSDIDLML